MIVFACIMGVLLLLLSPITVHATRFDAVLRISVRYLFLHWVFPRIKKSENVHKKAKKSKKKKEKPLSEGDTGNRKKEKGEPMSFTMKKGLLLAALRAMLAFLRGAHVPQFKLEIMVVGSNPYETALKSGKVNAAIYPFVALIQNYVKVQDLYLNIYPGFCARKCAVTLEGKAWMLPTRLFYVLGVFAKNAICAGFGAMREKKMPIQEETKESQRKARTSA